MAQQLSKSLKRNTALFEEICKNCDDIIRRPMRLGKNSKVDCLIVYIEVSMENMMLENSLLGKLLNTLWGMEEEEIYRYIEENGLGISDMKEFPTMEEAMASLLAGNAVIFIDGYDKALKIAGKGYPGRGVNQAESEKVIRGSNEAFSDSSKLNTALIRKRVRDARVKVREKPLGVRSHTNVALVYMEDLIYPDLLKEMEEKLESFQIDGILDSGMIEQLSEEKWYSPFPQFQTTERPDRAAAAVLEGRIVLLSDNSPIALILPTDFNCFMQAADDYYNRWEITSFTRIIRYIAVFLAMALPGLYLAVTNFHTQILPTDLMLSFAAARQGVPFPAIVEVLIMEIAFELLREAGVRLPGNMGNAIGVVGGLIIGQAAVEANIVSPIVVIVIAATALSSFAIPNEEFATAFRLLKFVFIFSCGFLGFFGFLLGITGLLIHLSHLKSFGIPYLMPFVGADLSGYEDQRNALIRYPFRFITKRPIFTKRSERVKLKMDEKNKK